MVSTFDTEVALTISVDAREFKSAIAQLKKVMLKRPTHSILEYVKIAPWLDGIKITATSLQTWLSKDIKFSEPRTWTFNPFCLKFKELEAFSKSIKLTKKQTSSVNIYISEGMCKVFCGAIALQVPIESSDDFPELPYMPCDTATFSLNGEKFISAINQVTYACSRDQTKKNMQGVRINHLDGNVVMHATDGHRIVMTEIKEEVWGKNAVLIPYFYDLDIVASCFAKDKHTTIGVHNEWCAFVSLDTVLTCKNQQTLFPDCNRAIGKFNPTVSIIIDRVRLLQQLKLGVSLLGTNYGIVNINETTIAIQSKYTDILTIKNDAICTIDGNGDRIGDNGNISFNLHYFVELLEKLTKNGIELKTMPSWKDNIVAMLQEEETTHFIARLQIND